MKCGKQLKIILDSTKSIELNIDAHWNLAINKVDGKGNVEEKEKIDQIFEEEKGLERPIGTWEKIGNNILIW